MPTALTGSLGWTGLHPVQLGGPPLTNTYGRSLPALAAPLIAHVYQNDGATFLGSFSPLNFPSISLVTTNGGLNQIMLDMAARPFTVTQGNVIRLTYQGGDGSCVYGGIVEDLPDVITPTSVEHKILLSPFGFELDDTHSTSYYTQPTDIAQIVRDAVDQTFHCSCDQVSVPPSIGVYAPTSTGGALDFRSQTVKQQIDTCRSLAGPTWFWHVDAEGRVWFQFQGSDAGYTVMRGQHYEERTSASSIQNRKNRVVAVGGVPTGGTANVSATYTGSSQSTIGIRALFPDLSVPNITDQASLTLIAGNIGAVLDRVWNRVQLKIHPPFVKRIHGSQPGGAMIRYWEPVKSPMSESEAGSGTYTGPYVVQQVDYDGLHQDVTAGDIPVTSQTDVTNMVNNLVNRAASNSLVVTAAALNLTTQVLTGTFQSGTGTVATNTTILPAALWRLDQQMFQAYDPAGVARLQEGNLPVNGSSPAQWGIRVNDASGNPIMDSFGLFGTAKPLNFAAGSPGQNITGSGVANKTTITSSGFSITIPNYGGRSQNIMLWLYATAKTSGGSGTLGYIRSNIVSFNTSADLVYDKGTTGLVSGALWFFPVGGIPPGTYTVQMEGAADTGQTLFVSGFFHQVWLAGSTG